MESQDTPTSPLDPGLETRSRFAPKLKPDVRRVVGNPFYPDGRTPQQASEFTRQVFEANLPVSQQEGTQKVGTMLNTVA